MINSILILHIIITALLIGVVLIQKSEGGALGMGGGAGGGFMTTRGTANLLTRITGVLAVLFFVTTLSLALLFKGEGKPKSLLDDIIPVTTPTQTAPVETSSQAAPIGDANASSAKAPASVKKEKASTPVQTSQK